MFGDAGGPGAMRQGKEILFEGYTEDEILALPKEQVEEISPALAGLIGAG